jgi:N-acetylglucosamine-6-sulfatase
MSRQKEGVDGVPRSARCVALGSALAVAGAIVATSATPAQALPRRPDIILIVTDDQRAGTLGWMPATSRYLRRRGTVFPHAMVPTSLCCPSRASMLTGLYAHSTKVWSNVAGWPRFVDADMQRRTVAVWLRGSGYRTALVGKYLNAFTGSQPPPGWAVWHSFTGSNARYYNYDLLHTNGMTTWYGSRPRSYSTDVLRRLAMRFITATPSDRPFFLYFAPYAPHDPADPAPRHASLPAPLERWAPPSLTEADLSDKPRWIRRLPPVSISSIHSARVRQYRSLRSVDEAVAAFLDAQRARRRLHNTLVILVGDNGIMWGDHRAQGKFVPYKGATRVPLAIAWPARLAGGRQDQRIALNIDIPVTIADAAGAPHDPAHGRSLLRWWRRTGFVLEASRARVHDANGTNVGRPAYCGWRTRRHLFVRYANGREELYDYVKDPWELQDRRGRRPVLQARLRSRAREACQPTPPGFDW